MDKTTEDNKYEPLKIYRFSIEFLDTVEKCSTMTPHDTSSFFQRVSKITIFNEALHQFDII